MELEYVNEHIGRKIKDLRNQNGLTQQELADRTELTKGFISQLERGQVSVIRYNGSCRQHRSIRWSRFL